MFTQLYLNDSFMIRKIIVAAVPAALVAVGMSLATSQPASSQCWRGRCHGGTTNTNQVYPNNQRGGSLNPGALQLSSGGGGRGGYRGTYLSMPGVNGTQYGVASGRGGHGPGGG